MCAFALIHIFSRRIIKLLDNERNSRQRLANIGRTLKQDVERRKVAESHIPIDIGLAIDHHLISSTHQTALELRQQTQIVLDNGTELVHPYYATEAQVEALHSIDKDLLDYCSATLNLAIGWYGGGSRPIALRSVFGQSITYTFTNTVEIWVPGVNFEVGTWQEQPIGEVSISQLIKKLSMADILRIWNDLHASSAPDTIAKLVMTVNPTLDKMTSACGISITNVDIAMGTMLVAKWAWLGEEVALGPLGACRVFCHSSKATAAAAAIGTPITTDLASLKEDKLITWTQKTGMPTPVLLTLFKQLVATAELDYPQVYKINQKYIIMYDYRRLAMNKMVWLWHKGEIWNWFETLTEVLAHLAALSGTSTKMLKKHYLYSVQKAYTVRLGIIADLTDGLKGRNPAPAINRLARISEETAAAAQVDNPASAARTSEVSRHAALRRNAAKAASKKSTMEIAVDTSEFISDKVRLQAAGLSRLNYAPDHTAVG